MIVTLAIILLIGCYSDLIYTEHKAAEAALQAERDEVEAEAAYEKQVRDTHRNSRKNALLLLRAVQRDIQMGEYHWSRMLKVVDSFYPEYE